MPGRGYGHSKEAGVPGLYNGCQGTYRARPRTQTVVSWPIISINMPEMIRFGFLSVINRPGVAVAFLQTPPSISHLLIQSSFSSKSLEHHKSQTVQARELSLVTCQMSPIVFFFFFSFLSFFGQSGWGSWWGSVINWDHQFIVRNKIFTCFLSKL